MDTLDISDSVKIPMSEIQLTAIRSQGPGGQNVNKVASAIHLRFDSQASPELSDAVKARLLAMTDARISNDGMIIIKSQAYRSQQKNRTAALARLGELLARALVKPRRRVKTKPSKAAKQKRLDSKNKRGKLKRLRRQPKSDV